MCLSVAIKVPANFSVLPPAITSRHLCGAKGVSRQRHRRPIIASRVREERGLLQCRGSMDVGFQVGQLRHEHAFYKHGIYEFYSTVLIKRNTGFRLQ